MEQIYKTIVALQHRTKDWMDEANSPAGRAVLHEIQKLEDEAQMKKNPRSLEHRVKSVIRMLESAGNEGAMDHHHADTLVNQFEEIQNQLRKL